jgi:site-specific DNA recombinase
VRVAIYARYSSDLQRQSSIDDQVRTCLAAVTREGWDMVHQFKDEALSGAKADRPGYQQLLDGARRREFNLIVVEEVSRLWRDQEEQWRAVRRLEFWGVHIFGVSDGINTKSEGYGLLLSIRGAMNEEARREIGKRTHRGLSGVAIGGNCAGGRSYGYRHIAIEDPARRDHLGRPIIFGVRREIDPEQAKWVRFIFERYVEGKSALSIADELNRLGVESPGATWRRKKRVCRGWARSAIYGDTSRGFGILLNPLYAGLFVWNRTRRSIDPDTKARKHALRPRSDWIVKEMPELRIVPVELWERAQARMTSRRLSDDKRARGGSPGRQPKYLFSGLLKCGQCGGNYIITSSATYGCAINKDRGAQICSNGLRVARSLVEEKLLHGIKTDLLSPENIALFRREFNEVMKERTRAAFVSGQRERLVSVDSEISNLISAIKAGIVTTSTKAELERLEAERVSLTEALARADRQREVVARIIPGLNDGYASLVAEFENVTGGALDRTRERIRQLVGDKIRLVPEGGHLVAEFGLNYVGLLKMTGTENIGYTEDSTCTIFPTRIPLTRSPKQQ